MTIYKITNKLNGKVYIGKTSRQSAERRWARHVYLASQGRQSFLYKAIRKYGLKSFTVTTLHSRIQTEKRLNTLERRYIKRFKSTDENHGYNLTEGGDGTSGYKHSTSACRRISKANKGNQNALDNKLSQITRKRMSAARMGNQNGKGNKGHKCSFATRRRISKSNRGQKRSLASRRKMQRSQMGNQNARKKL